MNLYVLYFLAVTVVVLLGVAYFVYVNLQTKYHRQIKRTAYYRNLYLKLSAEVKQDESISFPNAKGIYEHGKH